MLSAEQAHQLQGFGTFSLWKGRCGGTFQETEALDGSCDSGEPGASQTEKSCQVCLDSGHACCSSGLLVLLWAHAKLSGRAHGPFPGSSPGV